MLELIFRKAYVSIQNYHKNLNLQSSLKAYKYEYVYAESYNVLTFCMESCLEDKRE